MTSVRSVFISEFVARRAQLINSCFAKDHMPIQAFIDYVLDVAIPKPVRIRWDYNLMAQILCSGNRKRELFESLGAAIKKHDSKLHSSMEYDQPHCYCDTVREVLTPPLERFFRCQTTCKCFCTNFFTDKGKWLSEHSWLKGQLASLRTVTVVQRRLSTRREKLAHCSHNMRKLKRSYDKDQRDGLCDELWQAYRNSP